MIKSISQTLTFIGLFFLFSCSGPEKKPIERAKPEKQDPVTQWDAGVLTDSLVLHSVFPELTILPMRFNHKDSFIDVTAAQQDYGGDERTEPPFYHRVISRFDLGDNVFLYLIGIDGRLQHWHGPSSVAAVKFTYDSTGFNPIQFIEGNFCMGGKDWGYHSDKVELRIINDTMAMLFDDYFTMHMGIDEYYHRFKMIPRGRETLIHNPTESDLSIQQYIDDSGMGSCYAPVRVGDTTYSDCRIDVQYVFNEDLSVDAVESGVRGSGPSICADFPEDVFLFSRMVDSSRADHIRRYGDLEMWDDYCEKYNSCFKSLVYFEKEHHISFDGKSFVPNRVWLNR